MRTLYCFMEPKEKWEYLQEKGKLHRFLIMPCYASIISVVVVVVITFLFTIFDYNLGTAINGMKSIFTEGILDLLKLALVLFTIMVIGNIIDWYFIKKKVSKPQ